MPLWIPPTNGPAHASQTDTPYAWPDSSRPVPQDRLPHGNWIMNQSHGQVERPGMMTPYQWH